MQQCSCCPKAIMEAGRVFIPDSEENNAHYLCVLAPVG